ITLVHPERLAHQLAWNVPEWVGARRGLGALLAVVAAGAACATALLSAPRPSPRVAPTPRRGAVLARAAPCAIVAADVCACAGYAYDKGAAAAASSLQLVPTIAGTATAAKPGQEVDFVVTVANPTGVVATHVALTLEVPSGMQLLGSPYYERGSGCSGTSTIVCDLDFLEAHSSTPVKLGVRMAAQQYSVSNTLVAHVSLNGVTGVHDATFTVANAA